MSRLVEWLEANYATLIHTAIETLSQDAALQLQVSEAVERFYDALLQSAQGNPETIEPLLSVLAEWVQTTRSALINEEVPTLMPVLAKLKYATRELARSENRAAEAVHLIIELDDLFTEAFTYLSDLESEALLTSLRHELQQAQSEVERLNKNKSDFIAIAAHELKTPLTVVEGYLGMVRNSPQAAQDDYLLALANGAESGLRRLREIVDDIIDVSLLDLKLMELHIQPVWLHHLLIAIDRLVKQAVTQRQQELVILWDTIPEDPILADPERMLQVIYKVVTNAIKYTPDGGQITVSGRVLPGFVDLMVEDNGIGIASENLNRIFDAFSSLGDVALHSSGKVKFKGSGPGLGLPIAKGIIESHGGTLWAQSAGYDEQSCPGSIFHIIIPNLPDTLAAPG